MIIYFRAIYHDDQLTSRSGGATTDDVAACFWDLPTIALHAALASSSQKTKFSAVFEGCGGPIDQIRLVPPPHSLRLGSGVSPKASSTTGFLVSFTLPPSRFLNCITLKMPLPFLPLGMVDALLQRQTTETLLRLVPAAAAAIGGLSACCCNRGPHLSGCCVHGSGPVGWHRSGAALDRYGSQQRCTSAVRGH